MIRWFARLLALLIALVGMCLLTIVFAVQNTPASAWLVQRATAFVPGSLTVEDISGDLLSGLRFARLQYESDGLRVVATDAAIAVRWLDLGGRRLVLRALSAESIEIENRATDDAPRNEGLPAISLPLVIELHALEIQRLRLQVGGTDETLHALTGEALWQGDELQIQSLAAELRELRIALAGKLAFRDAWPLRANIRWQETAGERSGHGDVEGDLEALQFDQWLLLPDEIHVQGRLTALLSDPAIDARVNWERVQLPTPQGPAVAERGELLLRGRLEQYFFSLSSDLSAPFLPMSAIAAAGEGDLQRLVLDQLTVAGPAGIAEARGRVGFAGPDLALQVTGRQLLLSTWVADLPGTVDLAAAIHGQVPGPLTVRVARLSGRVLDQPVEAAGRILIDGEQLDLRGLRASSGANRIEFDGSLLPRLAGIFSLDAPSLDQLWPGLAGSIAGTGALSGTIGQPQARLDLRADELRLDGFGLSSLRIAGEITSAGDLDWRVEADGLERDELALGNLQLRLDGRLDNHDAVLELAGGAVGLRLESQGSWNGQRMAHAIGDGHLDIDGAGRWTLQAPFAISVDSGQLQVAAHCWQREPSTLCLDAVSADQNQQTAGGRLTLLPLALLQPWLGGGVELDGTADVAFQLDRGGQDLNAWLTWEQRNSRLRYLAAGEAIETELEAVRLRIDIDDAEARVSGMLQGSYGLEGSLNGSIAAPFSMDSAADLQVRGSIPDLSAPTPLLERYVPADKLQGSLLADFRVTGSLRSPEIDGEVSLANGAAFLPQVGIELEQVTLKLLGRNGQPVSVIGSARSGDGELRVDGTLDWAEATGAFSDLAVTGSDFQLLRQPDLSVFVSPDLRLHLDAGRANVTGTVLVPRAEIIVEALPQTAVAPSSDVVVHLPDLPVPGMRERGLELVGTVDVRLGDDVRFAGFGLNTHLGGNLKLVQPPAGRPRTAEGVLRTVDGRFSMSGKDMIIERGALIFSGPLEDPAVDVRATRKLTWESRDILVGVQLTGPISAIKTQVFGEPALSEADALSFLVLDRPASQARESGSEELSETAVALGLVKVLPITQQLEQGLGLDEVVFEGSGGDDTAVVAGKRINEDLFIRYKYGLFNRIGTFIVRYRVGRGFSIEAGSGEQQTLDLVYSLDR